MLNFIIALSFFVTLYRPMMAMEAGNNDGIEETLHGEKLDKQSQVIEELFQAIEEVNFRHIKNALREACQLKLEIKTMKNSRHKKNPTELAKHLGYEVLNQFIVEYKNSRTEKLNVRAKLNFIMLQLFFDPSYVPIKDIKNLPEEKKLAAILLKKFEKEQRKIEKEIDDKSACCPDETKNQEVSFMNVKMHRQVIINRGIKSMIDRKSGFRDTLGYTLSEYRRNDLKNLLEQTANQQAKQKKERLKLRQEVQEEIVKNDPELQNIKEALFQGVSWVIIDEISDALKKAAGKGIDATLLLNDQQQTPADVAKKNGHTTVVEFLHLSKQIENEKKLLKKITSESHRNEVRERLLELKFQITILREEIEFIATPVHHKLILEVCVFNDFTEVNNNTFICVNDNTFTWKVLEKMMEKRDKVIFGEMKEVADIDSFKGTILYWIHDVVIKNQEEWYYLWEFLIKERLLEYVKKVTPADQRYYSFDGDSEFLLKADDKEDILIKPLQVDIRPMKKKRSKKKFVFDLSASSDFSKSPKKISQTHSIINYSRETDSKNPSIIEHKKIVPPKASRTSSGINYSGNDNNPSSRISHHIKISQPSEIKFIQPTGNIVENLWEKSFFDAIRRGNIEEIDKLITGNKINLREIKNAKGLSPAEYALLHELTILKWPLTDNIYWHIFNKEKLQYAIAQMNRKKTPETAAHKKSVLRAK